MKTFKVTETYKVSCNFIETVEQNVLACSTSGAQLKDYKLHIEEVKPHKAHGKNKS
tara:strand:- start:158 stop:325 length:168 start_codon:yes stop_codon:yes gene_type:complete